MTPALQLDTLYVRDARGRLLTTREEDPRPAPRLVVIRSQHAVAWAIRDEVTIAVLEQPLRDWRELPAHVERYRALGSLEWFGPAYEVPRLGVSEDVVVEGERAAIVVDGREVSVCYCSRRSEVAAECGVDTEPAYRGRGYAGRVVAAWAEVMRATGRVPLYSTSWSNPASLAVARKLGLVPYATTWSIE